jgi:N-acylneuraminate cytidylyltransferase/CMP-N,N'-diacetyllegionaminic acid synthase
MSHESAKREPVERPLIIGAVCARGGSKGVPRKNLRILHGKPLIAYAIEQAHASGSFDRVVTSTDDEEMATAARRWGAEVPFIRPAELARDDSNKWHVFRHLVTELEARGSKVGIIADLDTGAALRSVVDIQACLSQLASSDADVCVTAYEADHNPYYNMVEIDRSGLARVCQPPAVPITNRQQAPPVYNLSPSIFAIRRDALWRHEHWSQCRMSICVVPRERAVDIDTEFDFRVVESLMEQRLRSAV